MAKQKEEDNLLQMESILANIKARNFSPVYILMGEEPYYSDILLEAFLEYTLEPSERDFNQTVAYAQDTTTADIVQACRRFPVFAPNGDKPHSMLPTTGRRHSVWLTASPF